jgi:hypothetical protein
MRRGYAIYQTSHIYFHSAYLDEHRDAADRIGAFLARREIVPRIETAFFKSTTRACNSFSPMRPSSADLLHRGRKIFPVTHARSAA